MNIHVNISSKPKPKSIRGLIDYNLDPFTVSLIYLDRSILDYTCGWKTWE